MHYSSSHTLRILDLFICAILSLKLAASCTNVGELMLDDARTNLVIINNVTFICG
jgi:hypothetical protein